MFNRNEPGVYRTIYPPKDTGGFCHFHACRGNRILFDISVAGESHIGVINADGSGYSAWSVASKSYCHVGHDREDRFLFASIDNFNSECGHHIAYFDRKAGETNLVRLTANLPTGRNQYCHAHPVLTPDRKTIIYTALGEDEKTHIYQLDISDIDTDNFK